MATTIDDYLTLSVTDLKRLGFLNPRELKSGVVSWKRGERTTAQVQVITDTRALPMCYLFYAYEGESRRAEIRLMFKHSNLDPEGKHGYYYFVCPVTGDYCRKLYAVDGQFMGRAAFRPLYPQQAQSRKQRTETELLGVLLKYDELQNSRYRKDFYRGKPTPYRLRWEKWVRRNAPKDPLFSQLQAFLESEQ